MRRVRCPWSNASHPGKDFKRSTSVAAFLRWWRLSLFTIISAFSLDLLPGDDPETSAKGRGGASLCSTNDNEGTCKRTRLGLGCKAGRCGVSEVLPDVMVAPFLRCALLSKLRTSVAVGPSTKASVSSSSSSPSGSGAAPPRIFLINQFNGRDTCLTCASLKPLGMLHSNNACFSAAKRAALVNRILTVKRPLYSSVNRVISEP